MSVELDFKMHACTFLFAILYQCHKLHTSFYCFVFLDYNKCVTLFMSILVTFIIEKQLLSLQVVMSSQLFVARVIRCGS